jgi:hypothetical protein
MEMTQMAAPSRPGRIGLSRLLAAALAVTVAASGSATAASWRSCNGTPVRPESIPMAFVVNGCSTGDNGTPRGRSVVNALGEVSGYAPLGMWGAWDEGACRIEHGDGQSDVAVVPASGTDGMPGLTVKQYDGCTFSWEEEHIEESDVMARSDLNFDEPDQSVVATASSDVGLGRAVMLHEMVHGVGLEHTGNFAIMRNGMGARVPWVGGIFGGFGSGNSSHVKVTPDDLLGLRNLHGIPQDYPDLFVSAQRRIANSGGNLIVNTDTNAAGVPIGAPQQLCPGDNLSLTTTVGNLSQFSRGTDMRIYADITTNCTSLDGVGTELSYWGVSVGGYSTSTFTIDQAIPASIPRNVVLRVYTAINVLEGPAGERRAYDDCARSAAGIIVPSPAVCGR